MKRIIFSLYNSNLKNHDSINDYKVNQFEKYKDELKRRQEEYAILSDADYHLFTSDHRDYDDLQFHKIYLMERLFDFYDEILYIDFDVIPKTYTSLFDKFDLNKLCVYSVPVMYPEEFFIHRTNEDNWHSMDMYVKTSAKNAMLSLDNITGLSNCVNTGVLAANKKSMENLNFSERISFCDSKLNEAKNDNLYPPQLSKVWKPNNEVYMSYLLERFNIPFNDIGLKWNFILDHNIKKYSPANYFIHQVNKDFGNTFQCIDGTTKI